MLSLNLPVILACGFIPMVIGFLYYHPKTLEPAWMKSTGLTREEVDGGNMLMIIGISYLLACGLSAMMAGFSIHQSSLQALFIMEPSFQDPNSEMRQMFDAMMAKYGDRHRTFGHGVVHGMFMGLLVAFPIIAIKSLFERKSWKHIIISALYWLIVIVLICGVTCQWGMTMT